MVKLSQIYNQYLDIQGGRDKPVMSDNYSDKTDRTFTASELAEFDGREGRPCYIAYEGRVYDVSESFLWKKGKHQALHRAGVDLTEPMKKAPHGEEFIYRFPVVGKYKGRQD